LQYVSGACIQFEFWFLSARRHLGAPSKTNSECLGNEVALGLDIAGVAAGFLPGGGLVTGSASAAATAFAVQGGVTALSTINAIAYKSGPGIVAGILGGQVALTTSVAEKLAVNLGKALPVVGAAVSAGAAIVDGYETYQTCSGGH
jgi:hypothetical protein